MHLTAIDEAPAVEFTEGELGYVGLTLKECTVLEMTPKVKEGMQKLHTQLTAVSSTILPKEYIQPLKKLLLRLEEIAKPGSTVHMLLQDSVSIIESATIMLASVER